MSLQAENCTNPEQLLNRMGRGGSCGRSLRTEAGRHSSSCPCCSSQEQGRSSSEHGSLVELRAGAAQNTGSLVEVSVHELMSSVWAARCRDGSEALRLILGRECCSSSMEDRIWGKEQLREACGTCSSLCFHLNPHSFIHSFIHSFTPFLSSSSSTLMLRGALRAQS